MKPFIIPFYHIVSDENLPHISNIYKYKNITQFQSDIEYFAKRYSFISLNQLIMFLNSNSRLPNNPILLTFDDGYHQVNDVIAPILKQKGIPAVFFINTDMIDNKMLSIECIKSLIISAINDSNKMKVIEKFQQFFSSGLFRKKNLKNIILQLRQKNVSVLYELENIIEFDFDNFLSEYKPYLTTNEIRSLISDGFEIGSHGTDHKNYSEMTLTEQIEKTKKSFDVIKSTFDINYKAFAFPFSDYGVSKDFFDSLYKDIHVNISFGTGGLIHDSLKYHFQRIWMENTDLKARLIILKNQTKFFIKNLMGKDTIKH